MTSLIDKIELLIKREKTTPERKKKEDASKSSSEILSELFSAFNADPPKIDEASLKKSKKSKKKHKKEKKKRSRSSSSSNSDDSDYSPKHKKRKKSKSKKKRDRSRSSTPSKSNIPPKIKADLEAIRIKNESGRINSEDHRHEIKLKTEPKDVQHRRVSIKTEEPCNYSVDVSNFDASLIPMPDSPKHEDLRQKLDSKKQETEDKSKSKIQIKNLKFSAVFEETVKKAEEEARKKAEKFEEGEYTDSSSSSEKPEIPNAEFPKSSDPGGILKKQAAEETKVSDEDRSHSKKSKDSSHKSSRRDRSRSRRRSTSKSRRSRSRSASRRRRRSRSRGHERSRRRSRSRTRERDRHERDRHRPRHVSPRHRGRRSRRHCPPDPEDNDHDHHLQSTTIDTTVTTSSSKHRRSPTGVKLADSEKKRLLEVARRNAINMLKNGAVPAGAAALPPHTRNQVMAAIQSGGKSVDELTDFCKHLSKKEALGELSSVSSHDEDMSENEDTLAFHHPFLVKEKAPIVMNIRGGAPLPIKTNPLPIANKEELRLQFPVSSGSQHREKATEWVPVSPPKKDMQVAKLNSKAAAKPAAAIPETPAIKAAPLALPAPPVPAPVPVPVPAPVPVPVPAAAPVVTPPPYMKGFTTGTQLASVPTVPALPAPGPQAYPPGIEPPKVIDVASIVSQKLLMIRKEQEQNELSTTRGSSIHQFGWSSKAGQFTGSTGAQILTPKELASGTQAWAKKDQLMRAAPVGGGMGMHLLQKMGWTPGQGLGKEGTGTLQPLLLEVKLDTRGLQAKEEASTRNNKGMKVQRQPRRGGAAPALAAGGKHPVSLLGEYCSKQKLGPPEYNLCFECGPDHKKNFLFKVRVAGTEYQPAVASANKKQAKADAAQLALQKLGIVTP